MKVVDVQRALLPELKCDVTRRDYRRPTYNETKNKETRRSTRIKFVLDFSRFLISPLPVLLWLEPVQWY